MYMNRSFLSKTKHLIWIGFKILTRSPIPNLPPSYPPPPRLCLALFQPRKTAGYHPNMAEKVLIANQSKQNISIELKGK